MAKKRRLDQQERVHLAALQRKEALDHYNTQNFHQALHKYYAAIDLDPMHAGAHKGKADTYYALERYEKAIKSYQQCILLDESYTLAYDGLGNALYALKSYKEAYHAYEQAIRLKLNQNMYFGKWKKFVTDGEEFHSSGLFEDALAAYELAILFNKSRSKGYTGKGNALFALGHTEEAQEMHKQAKIKSLTYHANEKYATGDNEESLNLYEQLLELEPMNAQASSRVGDALFVLEQYQKALIFYGKVLQIDPQNVYAYKRKGDTLFALKLYKEAYIIYKQVKRIDATYSKILNEQCTQLILEGINFFQHRNFNAALHLYEFAILFDPQSADAYSHQGKALSALDRYQEALNAYAQVIRLDPKNVKYHAVKSYCARGEIFYKLKEYDNVLVEYEQAFKLDYKNARKHLNKEDALFNVGMSFYQNKRYIKAVEAFDLDVLYNPQHGKSYLVKGNCFYYLKRNRDAFEAYVDCWHINPEYTVNYLGINKVIPKLGSALYDLAYYDEARIIFNMAVEFDPLNQAAYAAKGQKLIDKAADLFEHNEYENARIAYNEAIQFNPCYENIYYAQTTFLIEKGTKLHKLKNYRKALDCYEQALRFHPEYALAYAEKGNSLYALQRITDALTAYTKAMKLDSHYIEVFSDKALPLISQGDALFVHRNYEQAFILYEQALQFNPDDKVALAAKVKVLYKMRQFVEARRVADNLKTISTKNSPWLCDEPFKYE